MPAALYSLLWCVRVGLPIIFNFFDSLIHFFACQNFADEESTCTKCSHLKKELSAVIPRKGFSPLPQVDAVDTSDVLVEDIGLDTQEGLPGAKRQKPTVTETAATVDAKRAAAAPDAYDSDSSDPEANIPLAILFGKKKENEEAKPGPVLKESVHKQMTPKSRPPAAGSPSDPIVLESSQESNASISNNKAVKPLEDAKVSTFSDSRAARATDTANDDGNDIPPAALSDDACFVCGADLTKLAGFKGRLNHIKRCSKKHGVTARDVKVNDDCELFVSENASNDSWHADAATDLALANHNVAYNTGYKENTVNQKVAAVATNNNTTKQTTLGSFFQMPVRSLNNVLLAGARRMAKSNDIVNTKKSNGGSSNGVNQKRKRVDYSKVRSSMSLVHHFLPCLVACC